MTHVTLKPADQPAISELFYASFSDSEGEAEGRLIEQLVSALTPMIDDQEVLGFGTRIEQSLVGGIFFSRLRFASPIQVYLLSPVAVRPEHQRQGLGQALITFGLEKLIQQGAEVAVTYGDPAYYEQVGFQPLAEDLISAPWPLSMPFGWQGQSLTDPSLKPVPGRPDCVPPFNDPDLW